MLATGLAGLTASGGDQASAQAPFRVGAATAAAAFDERICLAGYGAFCNRPTTGTRDPLTTAAFAFTGGEGDTVIVAKTTAIGLFASYKAEKGATGIYDIRQRIARATGVPAGNVVVTSDHSHAAPDTIGIWGGVSRDYMERLADSVVRAATDAYAARRPARIYVAGVEPPEPKLSSSYAAPPTDRSAMDEEFRALFATTPDGEPIATLVNYAPHATACGRCGDEASGDWTAWAAQEIAGRDLGVGAGFVGALGATDWGKTGNLVVDEAEARGRINSLLDAAIDARREVEGDVVDAELVFVREQLAQPVLGLNLLPDGTLTCPSDIHDGFREACDEGDVSIDRSIDAPWLEAGSIGTYVGAFRIGDALFATAPGEPFPQIMDAIREAVGDTSETFLLGAAQDFLGYMVADTDAYQQTLEEGALFLAGCPEQTVTNHPDFPAGHHDGACPDHWTLMVSPTIGLHVVCTVQGVAGRLGFATGARDDRCTALTARDGVAAPDEHAGAPAEPAGVARAGVAAKEASWHIGASGGQFAESEPPFSEEAIDPHLHSTKKRPSYGLGSKSTVRALVVDDGAGDKVAIVSHDLYLPNDLLTRRIAQLVEASTGIPASHVMVTASHNHNSSFYSTPGWGTWIFQDVFDLRFFDYISRRAADAVIEANDGLVPVRMGGATSTFNEITSHTYGPKVADDGTPAGQPYDHTTSELTVVAFDDVTDPDAPEPLATWVVFGVHPEWTWGYDLINGDINHATMRIVDREVGGVTVWSGREIGTSGPHKDTRVHEPHERREYQDNGFAQLDRAARKLATAVEETRDSIAAGNPERGDRFAPMRTSFDVDARSERFAPAATRPYPGVSNCNTAALFHGDPRVPILGLPDCTSVVEAPEPLAQAGAEIYEQAKAAGVPIPESYSPTALTAVEETAAIHLQAVKLGDIGITVCPCEMFTDTALNIETRIDAVDDNLWLGWDWTKQSTPSGRDWCVRNDDGTWTCAHPNNPSIDLAPVSDVSYRRMVAQINNDAAGWEDDLATLGSEAEPAEPSAIKGNFTHEEFPDEGFALPIAVGMGNDYWGYVPEYREYRAHDHYRKALSGVGPHGADFLATRLSRLAASMNGGPEPVRRPIDAAYQAESARAEAMAKALGELGAAYGTAYEATLPADAGPPAITAQPTQVPLFSAAQLDWIGGSAYTTMPEVRVQRLVDGTWTEYANTEGDVQLTVTMPSPDQLLGWRTDGFEWRWSATFEAFGSDTELPDAIGDPRMQTPFGTYRFVVGGQWRPSTGTVAPYSLVGKPFEVVPWDGITVGDLRAESGGVSFTVGPEPSAQAYPSDEQGTIGQLDVPDTYDSPFRYIENRRIEKPGGQFYCSFCHFRPWADTSDVERAVVTIERPLGRSGRFTTLTAPATYREGRWFADVNPRRGDRIRIDPGDVVDTFGNVNGSGLGPLVVTTGPGNPKLVPVAP